MKRRENFTAYEIMPEYMYVYLSHFGPHFNKKLCDFATSQMFKTDANGNEQYISPMTKDELKVLIDSYGIKIKNNVLYDGVYVANMCKADYLGSSIKSEEELVLYVKDTLDDPDAIEGLVFNRWVGDMKWLGVPIDWEEML
jgi:hypothetical protein